MTIGCQENISVNNSAELIIKKNISAQNENIIFHGRVGFSNLQSPKIFWPGSGFTLWFEGTFIEVVLDDQDGSNYYNAIIDDDFPNRTVIDCVKGTKSYVISKNLTQGVHKLQLLRRTDGTSQQTIFKGIKISKEGKIISPQENLP